MRTITENALKIIKYYEGLHDGDLKIIGLQPKLCPAGIWTIGWGHALVDPTARRLLKEAKDKERAYQLYPNITPQLADELLDKDVYHFCKELDELFTRSKVNLEEHEFDAIVVFTYNVGIGTFMKSTMWNRLKNLDYKVADEFPKFKYAGGKILNGLRCRRASERELFSTGKSKVFTVNKENDSLVEVKTL